MIKLVLLLGIIATNIYAQSEVGGKVGLRATQFTTDQSTDTNRVFISPKLKKDFGDNSVFLGEFKSYRELNTQTDEIDIDELYYKKDLEQISYSVGMQEISFSETFGFNIMDILNPRSYREYIFSSPEWYKLSVFNINAFYFYQNLTFQTYLTPIPRHDILPNRDSRFSPINIPINQPAEFHAIDDSELAFRGGLLLENGIDLNLILASHQNRTPTFTFNQTSITPYYRRVESVGLTASYASENFVYRADNLLTINTPTNESITIIKNQNHFQSIYGVDWSGPNELTIGFQWHFESIQPNSWLSALIKKELLDRKIEPQLMIFRGINNHDLWIQPKLTTFYKEFQASLLWDIVRAKKSRDIFFNYKDEDRLILQTQLNF